MKKVVLFCLIDVCVLSGCWYNQNQNAEYIQRHGMIVGYVPGPFFHYGQIKLSEPRHFNLGDIPRENLRIKATIPISNPGRETLIIEKVDGLGVYFAGWDGDKQLEPRQKGSINIYFDKNKIESGHVTRFVRIYTNDPSNSEVKIFFDFNVIRSPEEEDIRSLQDEVQSIKSELQSLRKEIRQLTPRRNTGGKRESIFQTSRIQMFTMSILAHHQISVPDNAPVTIVEFFDFQCRFCVKEYPKIKKIMAEYPDKVRIVFKHFQLNFHKQAFPAHTVLELALLRKGR